MQRITLSIDPPLAEQFDQLIRERGYQNRSEAMRDILRQHVEQQRLMRHHEGHCVAHVSYVYDHHERSLAARLTALQHDHHDLTIVSTHVHLDHDRCLESLLMRGEIGRVRACAERIIAERGVHHGQIKLIPVDAVRADHAHPHDPHTHDDPGPDDAGDSTHLHYRPLS